MATLRELFEQSHLQQYGMTREKRDAQIADDCRRWCDDHPIRLCVGCMRQMPGEHRPECRIGRQ